MVSDCRSKVASVRIKQTTLKQISITEQKTTESYKTSITGILDVMRHQKKQMEIVTDSEKRVRAFPGSNINIKNLKAYFGEKVKIIGLAHFKPDRSLKFVEILEIRKASDEEISAEELTLPIFEDLDLKRLAKEQSWQGFDVKKFKRIIKELDVEESPGELLELLDS